MYPAEFEFLEPKSSQEVVEMLRRYGDDARILAGGQSLVPLMKLRLARPKYLIDLNRVPGLNYIKEQDGCVLFGALTKHAAIEASETVQARVPIMREAASVIGDSQVRNRGSIGGAIAEADPAGDWGPVVLALNAHIKCIGSEGERTLEAKDFFTFAYTTVLRPDEVLTEIAVPIPSAKELGTYWKLERVAGGFAVASVAIQADIDKTGLCRNIGIGLGGAHDRSIKAAAVEEFLRGKVISAEIMDAAAEQVGDTASPIEDLRGSSDYKKEVLKVIFRRALAKVAQQRK